MEFGAGREGLKSREFSGQRVHDFHGFDADANDLADEVDDVFFIIRVVGVALDAAAFIGAGLVLVDDPIEGAAVGITLVTCLEILAGFSKQKRVPV